ncbi:UDP-glucose/GDP-mannose dehydrogenase family protein [soil metagenome]
MNVSIIGCGYVGLVTGVCLADKGHYVVCVDIDATKVDRINNAIAPIHEVGLPELLTKHIGKNFSATTDFDSAVRNSDLTLIAVGTPFDGKEIDLTFVKTTAEQIGTVLKTKNAYHVVVVKSTCVPGTTDEVVGPTVAAASGKTLGEEFGLGMNPEFLSEGEAIRDFMNPDRIVLGGVDDRTTAKMAELYTAFKGVPVLTTNNKTAEMIKYTSNAMLATCISFANEIGNLCTALGGVDALEVMRANHINYYLSKRLPDGTIFKAPLASFFEAGCGYGGSCLPKDTKALVAHGEKFDQSMPVLHAVIDTNRKQPGQVLDLIRKRIPDLSGQTIAVLGLTFKPETDDLRESPAFPIIELLLRENAHVKAYDPQGNAGAKKVLADKQVDIVDSMAKCVEGAAVVVIVTKWDEFKQLPDLLKKTNPQALIVDGRRMLDKNSFPNYTGIGL